MLARVLAGRHFHRAVSLPRSQPSLTASLIEADIVAYCVQPTVPRDSRERLDDLKERRRTAAFTTPVFMQILIKRSSFPTTRVADACEIAIAYSSHPATFADQDVRS